MLAIQMKKIKLWALIVLAIQLISLSISAQDGKLDIVVGNNNQSNQYYINNGSALTMFDYGLRTTITYGITLGDVDNDGDLDIIEANSGSENLIYYNNGALRK